jgi:predicted histone-like DNA-binding protein
MALRYRKRKIVLNFDPKNPVEQYVATNVLVGSIDYNKLCDEVNQRTGIHRAMVDIVLAGAQDTMIAFLEEGFSVRLGEFGSFRPSIKAESQDTEQDVKVSTIVRRKIVFTPGAQFKYMLTKSRMELFMDNDSTTETDDDLPDETTDTGNENETPDPNV